MQLIGKGNKGICFSLYHPCWIFFLLAFLYRISHLLKSGNLWKAGDEAFFKQRQSMEERRGSFLNEWLLKLIMFIKRNWKEQKSQTIDAITFINKHTCVNKTCLQFGFIILWSSNVAIREAHIAAWMCYCLGLLCRIVTSSHPAPHFVASLLIVSTLPKWWFFWIALVLIYISTKFYHEVIFIFWFQTPYNFYQLLTTLLNLIVAHFIRQP